MQVSRTEVLGIVDALLSGAMTREEASRWAGPLHVEEMADPVVEEALDLLTLTDAVQITDQVRPDGYLYDFADIQAVRRALAE
jgi:hypothetical protein